MTSARRFLAECTAAAPIGLAYFAAAAVSLGLLYDGIPFLWLPTAVIIAALRVRDRAQWSPVVAVCAIAIYVASALFSQGWLFALPVAAIMLTEGVVASDLLTRARSRQSPLGSIGWLLELVVPIGIVGPALSAGLMYALCRVAGGDAGTLAMQDFCAHMLGNLAFTPLTRLVARDGLRAVRDELMAHGMKEVVGLLALVAGLSTIVFAQTTMPLLFLPLLPMILIAFRLGFSGAVLGCLVIASIAGYWTVEGHGPLHLMIGDPLARVWFLQFYLTTIVLTVLPVAADLQSRSTLLRALAFNEQRYRLMAEQSSDILLHLELDGTIRYVSPSIAQWSGDDPGDLVGSDGSALIAPSHLAMFRAGLEATLAARGRTHRFDFLAITRLRHDHWFEAHARAVIDERGAIDGLLCVVRDVADRKALQQVLSEAALTDPLTGLPNRRAFEAALADRSVRAAAGQDCVAMVDIDWFKRVNDGFGHDAGDAVLRTFAEVLTRVVRRGDAVARTGGEEFAILFPETPVEQALMICERLRNEMSKTVTEVNGEAIRVTVSGGVAMLGAEGPEAAIKAADRALYEAKRGGRNQVALAA